MKRITLLCFAFLFVSYTAHSQVLISLLLGDKLNSDKLEFGLIGGFSSASQSGVDGTSNLGAFHLGFYFDFVLSERWIFNPSVNVIAASGMEFTNQNPAVTGIQDLDDLLLGADAALKLEYFQVPLLMKYNVSTKVHLMLGPQLALRHKSNVYYYYDNNGNDLLYKRGAGDFYKRLDAGFTGGVGYKIKPGGMNFGMRYYQGLVDVLKDNPGSAQRNRSWYLYCTIPIGKGKPKAKTAAPTETEN